MKCKNVVVSGDKTFINGKYVAGRTGINIDPATGKVTIQFGEKEVIATSYSSQGAECWGVGKQLKDTSFGQTVEIMSVGTEGAEVATLTSVGGHLKGTRKNVSFADLSANYIPAEYVISSGCDED